MAPLGAANYLRSARSTCATTPSEATMTLRTSNMLLGTGDHPGQNFLYHAFESRDKKYDLEMSYMSGRATAVPQWFSAPIWRALQRGVPNVGRN